MGRKSTGSGRSAWNTTAEFICSPRPPRCNRSCKTANATRPKDSKPRTRLKRPLAEVRRRRAVDTRQWVASQLPFPRAVLFHCIECDRNELIERNAQQCLALANLLTVNLSCEGFVFHLLFNARNLDIRNS